MRWRKIFQVKVAGNLGPFGMSINTMGLCGIFWVFVKSEKEGNFKIDEFKIRILETCNWRLMRVIAKSLG